ncbi:MAG TPA: hypothetical protein VGC38_04685 [Pseudolabrys sp.]
MPRARGKVKWRTMDAIAMHAGIMLRKLFTLIVMAAILSATTAFAAAPKKKKVDRHWHGYGFLPGYRSPERIEWERRHVRGPSYGYGYYYYWDGRPRIYQGHVTDDGVGPCWTQTPIGPIWNCGK